MYIIHCHYYFLYYVSINIIKKLTIFLYIIIINHFFHLSQNISQKKKNHAAIKLVKKKLESYLYIHDTLMALATAQNKLSVHIYSKYATRIHKGE